MKLRRGIDAAVKRPEANSVNGLLSLGDDERHELALELLDEFGARNVHEHGDEITLSCCIPNGAHPNGDQNPSASFNWRKLTYHCYGCGEGGGLAWFVGVCRGEDSDAVQRWLKERDAFDEEKAIDKVNNLVADLLTPLDRFPRRPTLPTFDPSVLDAMAPAPQYMRDRGIPEATLLRALVRHDLEKNRVVIPHFWKGDLVGWQSRRLIDDGTAKYINTPGFPKGNTLYNMPSDSSSAVVVESPMSVLSKQHVEPSLTATFGASVTDNQVRLLGKFGRVVLWFDPDDAGWRATENVAARLASYTDVFVVDSPWNADVADLSDDEFRRLLGETVPASLWRRPTNLKEWK